MTNHEDDLDDEDELFPEELSPEEEAAIQRENELAGRYPTFTLLAKVLQRWRRLHRLRGLQVPKGIEEQEVVMLEKGLEELSQAFPYDSQHNLFTLPDILATLVSELQRPHQQGDRLE